MDSLTYALEDQALMTHAVNYFSWQAKQVLPDLGSRVVEVGCGIGNFTRYLLDREAVIAVDVEPACVERVRDRFPDQPNLHTLVANPEEAGFRCLARFLPDSCLCMNVLEHIKDDLAALVSMADILPAGGAVALLVPAFPALYGPIDRNLVHYRRYTAASLTRLASNAGLTVGKLRYMNTVGFFGWWANARLVKRQAHSPSQIVFFDRWIVPALSRIESVFPPPFGQSLIAVFTKT